MVVTSLKTRIGLIVAMVALSVAALVPRNTKIRERGPDGSIRDTVIMAKVRG